MTYAEQLKDKKFYKLYILWDLNIPIYVGITVNVPNRLRSHKLDKNFSHYTILELFIEKKEALAAERNIIKFLSVAGLEYQFMNAANDRTLVTKHCAYNKKHKR